MTSPDAIQVRNANVEDLPKLEKLRTETGCADSVLVDEQTLLEGSLRRLREVVPDLKRLTEWRVLVAEEEGTFRGYLVLKVDNTHGVTHQIQAGILDFVVPSFDILSRLLERAVKIVAAFENEYLVAEVAASEKRHQIWFYRFGFRAEQQRSAKLIQEGHKGASTPRFPIRPARAEDLPQILEIHSAYTPAYLPAGRDTDLDVLEFQYQLTYLGLDLEGSDGTAYLVMEDAESGAMAGYVFLKPGSADKRNFYMYDIAVAPAFAGRGLSQYLVGAAETLTGERGGYLYGDGSLNTPVIASWHKQMGAIHDSTLFALDCRPFHK